MKTEETSLLQLYSYWRSSAAYRVRIALNLKRLPFQTIPVNLVRQGGEQLGDAFRAINPQGLVPVLRHEGLVLTQSMAICEYLDERFDQYPLLPEDSVDRARVRAMALQVACDIHPLNNLRVNRYIKDHCGENLDTVEWMSHWMREGFTAIEQQLSERGGNRKVYYGEDPGLFECFLIPQVYNAERYGVEMSAFPAVLQIVSHCKALVAFDEAAPENQPDSVSV